MRVTFALVLLLALLPQIGHAQSQKMADAWKSLVKNLESGELPVVNRPISRLFLEEAMIQATKEILYPAENLTESEIIDLAPKVDWFQGTNLPDGLRAKLAYARTRLASGLRPDPENPIMKLPNNTEGVTFESLGLITENKALAKTVYNIFDQSVISVTEGFTPQEKHDFWLYIANLVQGEASEFKFSDAFKDRLMNNNQWSDFYWFVVGRSIRNLAQIPSVQSYVLIAVWFGQVMRDENHRFYTPANEALATIALQKENLPMLADAIKIARKKMQSYNAKQLDELAQSLDLVICNEGVSEQVAVSDPLAAAVGKNLATQSTGFRTKIKKFINDWLRY